MSDVIPPGKYFIRPMNAPQGSGLSTGLTTCPFPPILTVTVDKPRELWEVVAGGVILTAYAKYDARTRTAQTRQLGYEVRDKVLVAGLHVDNSDIMSTYFKSVRADSDFGERHRLHIREGDEYLFLTYDSGSYPPLTFQPKNDNGSQLLEFIRVQS